MGRVPDDRRERRDGREEESEEEHRLSERHERRRGEIRERSDEADASEGPRDEGRAHDGRYGRDDEAREERATPSGDAARHRTPNERARRDQRRDADGAELIADVEHGARRDEWRRGANREQRPRRRRPL